MLTLEEKRRGEDETICEWIIRISEHDATWLRKARRRQKYKLYYDIVFKVRMKYHIVKRNIENKLGI
tara:strand:- start:22 stop:222 length:201 start_codon:yes stop_codon:yes gene_type:complete